MGTDDWGANSSNEWVPIRQSYTANECCVCSAIHGVNCHLRLDILIDGTSAEIWVCNGYRFTYIIVSVWTISHYTRSTSHNAGHPSISSDSFKYQLLLGYSSIQCSHLKWLSGVASRNKVQYSCRIWLYVTLWIRLIVTAGHGAFTSKRCEKEQFIQLQGGLIPLNKTIWDYVDILFIYPIW